MVSTRSSLALVAIVLFGLFGAGCENKPAAEGAKPGEAKPEGKAEPKAEKKAAPASAKVASCNVIKAESICRQYGDANISAAGEDFLKNMCTGEFKMEACPADKRVGSCATPEGTKVYYNEGPLPMAADAAAKACKEGVPAGEWKAGQ
ncbi:hypothetical protein [Polyangium fumosum]|uniref:Uncharacterized protein n=1 Tax=Polyangium fumosum TaxID=889272 RepID=A0A4U1IUW6_9BACT|nr:hypothetical protein [Polyangium fumosum]TKC97876.1 hypothetical protein E8A74_43585 [Polyangium fumosum]